MRTADDHNVLQPDGQRNQYRGRQVTKVFDDSCTLAKGPSLSISTPLDFSVDVEDATLTAESAIVVKRPIETVPRRPDGRRMDKLAQSRLDAVSDAFAWRIFTRPIS